MYLLRLASSPSKVVTNKLFVPSQLTGRQAIVHPYSNQAGPTMPQPMRNLDVQDVLPCPCLMRSRWREAQALPNHTACRPVCSALSSLASHVVSAQPRPRAMLARLRDHSRVTIAVHHQRLPFVQMPVESCSRHASSLVLGPYNRQVRVLVTPGGPP